MKRMKKFLALLLIPAMLLLAACGDDSGEDAQELSGTVYMSEFRDLELPKGSTVNQTAAAGDTMYLAVQILDEAAQVYDQSLYRMPADGSGLPERMDGGETVRQEDASTLVLAISQAPENTVWVLERRMTGQFDLPEDFSAVLGNKWDYCTSKEESYLLRRLDRRGQELSSVNLTAAILKLEDEGGRCQLAVDQAGNCYAVSGDTLTVLGSQGEPLITLEEPSLASKRQPVALADGTIAVLCVESSAGPADSGDTYTLRAVNLPEKAWGQAYALPKVDSGLWCDVYRGSGGYAFLATLDNTLYGWREGALEAEPLLSWQEAGISSLGVYACWAMPDGRIGALLQSFYLGGVKDQIAVLTETERANLADQKVLTLASSGISTDMWKEIRAFNSAQTEYRIEAKDYSVYNVPDDQMRGYRTLLTEISAGRIPDILYTGNLPLRQFAAKGMLEDLWPYIDSDPEISRDSLMVRVLEADQVDGRLYEAFSSFWIQTVVGDRAVVGERMSWTVEDLRSALASMPEGCSIFSGCDTQEFLLGDLLEVNNSRLVDWEAGTCSFHGEEFRQLLALCKEMPAEINDTTEGGPAALRGGMQMLEQEVLGAFGRFDEVYMLKKLFGCQEVSFVGYPTVDGSVGSRFVVRGAYAISSTCRYKDGAWGFVRKAFLHKATSTLSGFPVNRADFEKLAAQCMDPDRMKTQDGEDDPNKYEEMYLDGVRIVIDRPVSQSEYDQLMDLYSAVDSVQRYDYNIRQIVLPQAAVYFAGDATLDETVQNIQSRVELYVNEQK